MGNSDDISKNEMEKDMKENPEASLGYPTTKGTHRDINVGNSNYADHAIQPWDIWIDWRLNPWDADIIKRTLRTKTGASRKEDYEKIIHICTERIMHIDTGIEV